MSEFTVKDHRELRCSFCGKGSSVVKYLIAGPRTYICDECVAGCVEIIDSQDAAKLEYESWRVSSSGFYLGPLADDAAAEIERLRAQLEEQSLELRKANIKLRDRAHPSAEPRDPPEVLASAGFWPDCGCGECYAIHCLGNALAQLAERDREAERLRDLLFASGAMTEAPCFSCGYNGAGYFQPKTHPCAARHHAAIDAAMAERA